jgi:hypothetical protein
VVLHGGKGPGSDRRQLGHPVKTRSAREAAHTIQIESSDDGGS